MTSVFSYKLSSASLLMTTLFVMASISGCLSENTVVDDQVSVPEKPVVNPLQMVQVETYGEAKCDIDYQQSIFLVASIKAIVYCDGETLYHLGEKSQDEMVQITQNESDDCTNINLNLDIGIDENNNQYLDKNEIHTSNTYCKQENYSLQFTQNPLTRFITLPVGSELTGLYVDPTAGHFFFNAQHPDTTYTNATIGVINYIDFNQLPGSFYPLAMPSADQIGIVRAGIGEFQALLKQGEIIPGSSQILGGIYDAQGQLIDTSVNTDFNAFIPINDDSSEGYLYTSWEDRPAGLSQLHIKWNQDLGSWDLLGGQMVNMSHAEGAWALCFGTVSPWGTPFASEELYFDETKYWNSPYSYSWYHDPENIDQLEQQIGHFPNAYDYGYIIEITDEDTPDPQLVKHFTMGRFSHENAQVMGDNRTVYLSDDGRDVVLFKFIMDEENDLSSGELFAARVTQDGTTNIEETGFDVEWISMGHANNSIISSWIDEYDHITRDDFRGDGNSYITDEEIHQWAESHLNTDLDGDGSISTNPFPDDRVAFLESRKAAAALQATDEWNKMEGLVAHVDVPGIAYMAIADASKGMSDTSGDIQLSENKCGIVYALIFGEDFNVTRIEPAIAGGPYDAGESAYACSEDNIANPDNILLLNDGRLIIGEDSNYHEQNMGWIWDPSAEIIS